MRVGQNPAKQINNISKPQRITVAVLNYIPYQKGYFSESFSVLQRCLGSILENTQQPFDLMVFDNGSCTEVKHFLLELQAAGKIQYLVFSEKNVGKGGAWEFIFNAAPGEIIAYSDNDALFYKNWLKKSVKVLETFPRVGMVTARALRTSPELSTNTVKWANSEKEAVLEQGDFIDYADFYDFSVTLGYSDEKLREEYESKVDQRITYHDVRAFVGANHFQFTGWKKILQECLPFDMQKPLGQVRELDEKLNHRGYLRLMIDGYLVQNMSNRIPAGGVSKSQLVVKKKFRFRDIRIVRKILLWIHDRVFNLYYEK